MSIEDQYDAWVRDLMGSARASTKREADAAAQSVEEMQRALDEMTAQSQKRRTAAGKAADAVGRAADATMENVRRMSSELTASLKKDGLLDNAPPKAGAGQKAGRFCGPGGPGAHPRAGPGRVCGRGGQGLPPPLCDGRAGRRPAPAASCCCAAPRAPAAIMPCAAWPRNWPPAG